MGATHRLRLSCSFFLHRDLLIRSRDIFGHRYDIESLCPGPPARQVNDQVIAIAAEKIHYWQKSLRIELVWALPPYFAVYNFQGYFISSI